jgi:hypothetical protein
MSAGLESGVDPRLPWSPLIALDVQPMMKMCMQRAHALLIPHHHCIDGKNSLLAWGLICQPQPPLHIPISNYHFDNMYE